MREKVRFEPFRLFTSVKQRKKESRRGIEPQTFGIPPLSHRNSLQRVRLSGSSYMTRVLRVYITGSLIPFTNVTVATSLILTVRRQRVLLELRNGPRSPWSLSVVEHCLTLVTRQKHHSPNLYFNFGLPLQPAAGYCNSARSTSLVLFPK